MAHTRTRMLRAPGVLIALAAAFALTGCFGIPGVGDGEAAKDGAEKLIEEMSGGESDIEIDGELPDNFPDSVPLIDGTIQSAVYLDMEDEDGSAVKGWNVSLSTDDGAAAGEEAHQLLLDAGFTEEFWNDSEGLIGGMFSNAEFSVTVGVFGEDGTVGYTVIPVSHTE